MNRSLSLLLMFIAGIAVVVLLFRNPVVPSHVSPPVPQPVVAVTPSNALPPVPVMQPPAVVSNVVPPPPPFVPPAFATPALSNVVDRRLDYVERVRILTSGGLPEVKDSRDLATLATVLADPKEDEVVRHEIVNLLNRSGDPELESRLFQILENPAEGQKFRAWAVQHIGDLLTNPGDIPVSPDLAGRVRSLLSDSDLHVRREALLALSRANDTRMLQELPAMLKSQAPGSDRLRDLAIRIARQKDLRDQIPFIRTLIAATNESVRIAAIVALSEWRDQESRPAIESALKEGSMGVKRAAAAALQRLDTPPKNTRE